MRKRKDGSCFPVSELAVPIIVAGERISDYVIFRDLSETRRAEEALQQAQSELAHLSRVTAMGELVASIAHEVNQPIAGVVTNGAPPCAGWQWNRPSGEFATALTWIIEDANAQAQSSAGFARWSKRIRTNDTGGSKRVIRGVLKLMDNETAQRRRCSACRVNKRSACCGRGPRAIAAGIVDSS